MAETDIIWWKELRDETGLILLQPTLDYIDITTTRADAMTISVLKISNLDLNRDTAEYMCQDSEYSLPVSLSAQLFVYQPPYIKMVTEPKNPLIEVGKPDNIVIYCATNGRTVEWEKNGVKINGSGLMDLDADGDVDIIVNYNNTLKIINNSVSNAGTYICYMEHTLNGNRLREEQSVDIGAAVVVELDQSVSMEEGETAYIKCEAQGYPVPTVIWYKESNKSVTHELVNGTGDGRVWISTEAKPEMVTSTLIIMTFLTN
uniref:Hemicentin-2-like n=1 Tax=Saccoglossus kowalevskii TaxID=10224 RepID=A0ABM0MTQ9_SACKO|nr:PREDICTED: hemicentin-2-like [Saccoglossus kowalevskii]